MSKIFFEFANKLLGDVKNLEMMSKKAIDLNYVVRSLETFRTPKIENLSDPKDTKTFRNPFSPAKSLVSARRTKPMTMDDDDAMNMWQARAAGSKNPPVASSTS